MKLLKDTTVMKNDQGKILAAHFVKDNKYQQCKTSVVCEYIYRFRSLDKNHFGHFIPKNGILVQTGNIFLCLQRKYSLWWS